MRGRLASIEEARCSRHRATRVMSIRPERAARETAQALRAVSAV